MKAVHVGLVGGGLMGREAASALSRWFALNDLDVQPVVTAVCDTSEAAREWFSRVPTISTLTGDLCELLKTDVKVVYVAVPHHLHEEVYISVLEAGKDLFAEKPFGIDIASAQRISHMCERSGKFVRCSSEFPFFPGVQRAFQYVKSGACGEMLQMRCAFLHSSDMDREKPINWKRQSASCGEIGVMGDLGLHVAHLPLRLGVKPLSVYAELQNVVKTRPDGNGGVAECDTFDNATLHLQAALSGNEFPLTLEMKRLAPGETNTWVFEAIGMDGGVRYSTKEPKTMWTFEQGKEQSWRRTELGYSSVLPAITGGIFEFGFPDAILQMWGAYLLERDGSLGERFGCATPQEALDSHKIFDAAMRSHQNRSVEAIS